MSGLATIPQRDWSAGAERDVAPWLVDERGFLEGLNTLLDDDGYAYKRGGSIKKSNAAFGASLRFAWEGTLYPGRRTLIANSSAFGVLDTDDATVKNLGGPGLALPKKARALKDLLFIGGGSVYGGSRKVAPYSTGTVDVTISGATVVGHGTSWLANVDAGMLFRGPDGAIYPVASITDDTHLTLIRPYAGPTLLGQTYTLKPIEAATSPYKVSDHYLVAGNRLLAVEAPNIVRFSAVNDPSSFAATDFHEVPEGAEILGLASVAEEVFVFTSVGIYDLHNIAFNLVDELGNVEQWISLLSSDLILWGESGIASYQDSVIAPCLDGIYLMDGRGGFTDIARGIRKLYRGYVESGHRPGGAVTCRNHYFLPILSAAGSFVDLLVCRLDRPVRTRAQTLFPWTQQDNAGAKISMLVQRTGEDEAPALFAGGLDGFLLDLTGYFTPTDANSADHDGTVALWELVTRDYGFGESTTNRWKKARALYEMLAATGSSPKLTCEIGVGAEDSTVPKWNEVVWNEFQWADAGTFGGFENLAGGFGPDRGVNKAWWTFAKRAPYVRFRLRCAQAVAEFRLREFEVKGVPVSSNRLSRVSD